MGTWNQSRTLRVVCHLRDAEGKAGRFTLHMAGGSVDDATFEALAADVGNLVQSCTRCQVTSVTLTLEYGWNEGLGEPGSRIEEVALLIFAVPGQSWQQGAAPARGAPVEMRLPSPSRDLDGQLDMYLADGETVNPSGRVVSALRSLFLGPGGDRWVVSTISGAQDRQNSVLLRGYRTRARTRRTFAPGFSTEVGGD
jgi:hypothetical protein